MNKTSVWLDGLPKEARRILWKELKRNAGIRQVVVASDFDVTSKWLQRQGFDKKEDTFGRQLLVGGGMSVELFNAYESTELLELYIKPGEKVALHFLLDDAFCIHGEPVALISPFYQYCDGLVINLFFPYLSKMFWLASATKLLKRQAQSFNIRYLPCTRVKRRDEELVDANEFICSKCSSKIDSLLDQESNEYCTCVEEHVDAGDWVLTCALNVREKNGRWRKYATKNCPYYDDHMMSSAIEGDSGDVHQVALL